MEIKSLPIGIESFAEIRTENCYYIDKTLLIRNLLQDQGQGKVKVALFTRPRRFGKSLNMSMLKSFFKIGTDPALFAGLAISTEKDLCAQHMGQYPVLFLSLKDVEGLNFAQAYAMLCRNIRREANRFQFLLQSSKLTDFDKQSFRELFEKYPDDATIKDSLYTLTELLTRHYSQKAILLIDEYDVPLNKAYQYGYYQEMIALIRGMFSKALKSNDNLYLGVLTGGMRVSKESIFTGLNNLKVYSITDIQFDEYFGFTDQEVKEMLNYYGLQEHYAAIKEWYDGYRFGNQKVYCPWDVLNYCCDVKAGHKAGPLVYWLNSSGNEAVRRLLDNANTATVRREIEQLIDGKSIHKKLNLQMTHNEIDNSLENIWSLLFMSGYLTLADKAENNSTETEAPSYENSEAANNIYELVIPNKEVRQIYREQVLAWFKDKAQADTTRLSLLFNALAAGNAAVVQDWLNKVLLTSISFYDAYETFYHGFLLALLSSCADWQVTSNTETGRGRSDILVESIDGQLALVLEVKYVKSTAGKTADLKGVNAKEAAAEKLQTACEQALRQIEQNEYAAFLQEEQVPNIWLYGIAFYRKQCRVVTRKLNL